MLLSVYESFRVSLLIECLLMLEMYFLKTILFWPFVAVGHGSMAAGFVMYALHYHRTFSFSFFIFW